MPPIDDLPGKLIIPTRDQIRESYLRDTRIRKPEASTVEGTLDYADAQVFADNVVGIYYNAKNIGDYVANKNKSGAALDEELKIAGTERLPATGGVGYVLITASTGGGTIFAEDEIKDDISQLRFKCIATKLYVDGDYVPIVGVDTGPSTNLNAGTLMKWTFPRPGISPIAAVIEQTDGTGLSGGRNAETDSQANERLTALRAAPPASGNEADYQAATLKTPGLIIQQAFTYGGIRGNGSMGVAFTLRPGVPGGNRIPNASHIAAVNAWLIGKFPGDDSILVCALIAHPVTLIFEVDWKPNAASWADAITWPLYAPSSPVKVDGAVTPTSTTFRLTTTVSTATPQAGSTIAFYDRAEATFRRKRILSVTTIIANRSWDIVVDIVNNASDTSYVPLVDQLPCPWSDSLQSFVTPVTTFFDNVGPGEQVDPLPDPNLRMRRMPRSPAVFGNSITNRITSSLFVLPAVNDVELKSPDVPYHTPVGSPGISSYLLELGSIVIFPQQ